MFMKRTLNCKWDFDHYFYSDRIALIGQYDGWAVFDCWVNDQSKVLEHPAELKEACEEEHVEVDQWILFNIGALVLGDHIRCSCCSLVVASGTFTMYIKDCSER